MYLILKTAPYYVPNNSIRKLSAALYGFDLVFKQKLNCRLSNVLRQRERYVYQAQSGANVFSLYVVEYAHILNAVLIKIL